MSRRHLMRHQIEAKLFIRRRTPHKAAGQALLALAPGTGKTLAAIRTQYPPNLVLCRRDDFATWRSELHMEGLTDGHMVFIDSSKSEHLAFGINDEHFWGASWFFITWDLMRQPLIAKWVIEQPFMTVYGDEIHTIKRWEAKRTKASIRSTRHIPRRVGMTGTPITNEVMDIWSQCMFIDNGRTFGDNPWKFKLAHYVQAVNHAGWYPKRGSKKLIEKQLKKIAIHVHEDDVLKLPPIRQYMKSCPATGMQRRLLEQLTDEWEMEVRNQVIELNHTITRLEKMKQIAAGFAYVTETTPETEDPSRVIQHLKTNKLPLLMSLLKDPDYFKHKPKIVIWGSYHAELNRIGNELKRSNIKFVKYYGDHASPEARTQFRDDPKVRIFLGQVDRGVGMNELIVADTAIYVSNSRKVVSRQQSLRRIRRKGSEIHKSITYVDLVTEDTVELPLVKAIKGGVDFAKSITDALKRGGSVREVLSQG